MTASAMLDLKQRLSKLSASDRRMASAYLLRLKHESPAGRREATRTMKEMDAGKKSDGEIWPSNSDMHRSGAYEPALSGKASSFLVGSPKARQKKSSH